MAQINIKTEKEYLREIVDKVNDGTYAIPVFQRNFVWKEEQVLALFDSIYRGYPIGTIILWKPDGEFVGKSKDILTDEKKNSPKPEYYVLDGRQRLTSFYGCVVDKEDKDKKLDLYYNLDKEYFEYVKSWKKSNYTIKVCDLYDTFALLGKMDELRKQFNEKESTRLINNAKELNKTLQSYVIGEIKLENCSLDEASTVFSRINSEGTDISKVSMLQADYYRNDSDILVADELDKIIEGLGVYGFDGLSSNDLLSCLYLYVGKNFYDDFSIEAFKSANLKDCIQRLGRDLENTVRFLYDECYVKSYKMLPYLKQLQTLLYFFKNHTTPNVLQKTELKKWFFYTTYQQSFQNSSLAIVRKQFQTFKDYVHWKRNTAFDYESVYLDRALDFKFSVSSAKSNMLMLTMAYVYSKHCHPEENSLEYLGQLKINQRDPSGVFIYFNHNDKIALGNLYKGDSPSIDYSKYILTDKIAQLIIDGNIEQACSRRRDLLVDAEQKLLSDCGIEIKTTPPLRYPFNIRSI